MMFKPGDTVICIKREFGNETIGKEYIVESVDEKPMDGEIWFQVVKDDMGKPNGYPSNHFKLKHVPLFYSEGLDQ